MKKWAIYISPYIAEGSKYKDYPFPLFKLSTYWNYKKWGLICEENDNWKQKESSFFPLKKGIEIMQNTLSVIKQYGKKALDENNQIKDDFWIGKKKYKKNKFPIITK